MIQSVNRRFFNSFSLCHPSDITLICRAYIEELAPLATESLLLFIAIRRSLFNSVDATLAYYETALHCFIVLLSDPSIYTIDACHSNLAQALAKFKINIQLSELVKMKDFPQFYQVITGFAVDTLTTRGYFGDFPYVLILWSRLLDALRFTSIPVFEFISRTTFEENVKCVCRAYVETLLNQMDRFMMEEESCPLDNIELILKHEEKLNVLLTFDYHYLFELILKTFEQYQIGLRLLLNQIQQQWNETHELVLSNDQSKQIHKYDCI